MIKVEIILKQEDMIKFLIQDFFQKEIYFNNINSLQRDTASYWLNSVQKWSNWRWWAAILDLIEARNMVWYSILKTINPNIFINLAVHNLTKRRKNINQEFLPFLLSILV